MIEPSPIGNVGNSDAWNPNYKLFTYFLKQSPFTQWSMIPFTIEDDFFGLLTYNCAEQWMMASKAKLFNDLDSMNLIMDAKHPREQKELGRKVKGFDKEKWNEVARDIVYQGNLIKFKQNKDAREALFATKDTLLVEVNPHDAIWGIALTYSEATNGKEWQGTNWLGEVLTKVRNDLT
jgi:ribA/ribD-fused uncharacterized protein